MKWMADTEVRLWPQSRHEVVMLLGKGAEIDPRQVNHMTQSGMGVGDSRDRRQRNSGVDRKADPRGRAGQNWEQGG